MLKKFVFISAILLAGCGYEGSYRYECQDPENWEVPECNPPICLVDNMCTEIILGFDPSAETEKTIVQETINP